MADFMPSRSNPEPSEILRRLGRIEILRALPPEEIQALVPLVEYQILPAGSRIIQQGDKGDGMYFIESGEARVERAGSLETWTVRDGSVVGEMALLTGERRSASVTSTSELHIWRIAKSAFDQIVNESPNLKRALTELVEKRLKGIRLATPNQIVWVATAMRALEARYRGIRTWQAMMMVGLVLWVFHLINLVFPMINEELYHVPMAFMQFIAGLLILQGSCEAFVTGVERLGARRRWDGFISGTVGSLLSTLPEFVVIIFLIRIDPLAAFVTAVVTIFNNALAFSVYSFFLPKDRKGCYTMPRSLTIAGGELLIAGAAITLIVGVAMMIVRVEGARTQFQGMDLLLVGTILMAIYGYYVHTLVRYYAEGLDDKDSMPPDPERLGHDTSWQAIWSMFALGIIGAYCGGESIGAFAETMLVGLHLPTIPTSAGLAFFAGISEYIIVYKSHQRGELGIALSNVFGGLTQVMFMLLPFSMVVIGLLGYLSSGDFYAIPINITTSLLVLLLFPLFYTLHQHIQQEKNLSNMDAVGMTGVYVLLLYFLFTYPN